MLSVYEIICFLVLGSITFLYGLHPPNSTCIGSISDEEYAILEELYDSTDGPSWSCANSSDAEIWSFPSLLTAPCSAPWQGIACGPAPSPSSNPAVDCVVISIYLRTCQLRGSLPDSLYSLTSLQFLDLSGNLLTGAISESIYQLDKVNVLFLCANNLTGTIPTTFGLMNDLVYLELYQNQLTGNIPPELESMSSLSVLFFFQNSLTGTIPTQLGQINSLTYLDVNSNSLTGSIPKQLCQLQHLELMYLFQNPLTGTIPNCIGNFSEMTSMYIFQTFVNETIPTEIGLMTNLVDLALNNNYLTGTLPTELGLLSALNKLYVLLNYLTGTIPTELTLLQNISFFDLSVNLLSGPIPTGIFLMKSLDYLYFYNNMLTGPLPSNVSVANFHLLQIASDYNLLTQTIPSTILSYSKMNILFINNNYFTGMVPDELYSIVKMVQLFMSENYFTGSLQPTFGNMNRLHKVMLFHNLLTGPIPDSIGNCVLMSQFDAHHNALFGTIPNSINNISLLSSFDVSRNSLTGTVPLHLWSSPFLRKLNVSFNFLTGSIPVNIFESELLTSLYLESNLFTNSIPIGVGNKRLLQSFSVPKNYLTSTIPFEIATSTTLISLSAAYNYLSGTISTRLSDLSQLQYLNLSRNLFEGPINNLFNDSNAFLRLVTIDLSQNGFTGPLLTDLFQTNRKNLSDVVVFSNCFSGSIPKGICSTESLNVLVMDAVTSAGACNVRFGGLIDKLFRVKIAKRRLIGSIPQCLWQMPNLNTLHLSGNGLVGTIADFAVESGQDDTQSLSLSPLRYLSLSSNRLSGTIPLWLQMTTTIQNLDLSLNKLSGTISSSFFLTPSSEGGNNINLTVNRLSGDVPTSFHSAEGIDVLNENLLQCNKESIPMNDPNSKVYVCGSDNFDDSLFAFCGVVGIVIIFVIIFLKLSFVNIISKYLVQFETLISATTDWELHHQLPNNFSDQSFQRSPLLIIQFVHQLQEKINVNFRLGIFYLFFSMGLYIIIKNNDQLKRYYSTHTHQYMWVTSIAYLHGFLPFLLLLISLLISIFIVIWKYYFVFKRSETEKRLKHENSAENENKTENNKFISLINNIFMSIQNIFNYLILCVLFCFDLSIKFVLCITSFSFSLSNFTFHINLKSIYIYYVNYKLFQYAILAMLIIFHCVVILTVNILYVYSVLVGMTTNLLFIVQFGLSSFKLLYSLYFIPKSLAYLLVYLPEWIRDSYSSDSDNIVPINETQKNSILRFQMNLNIFLSLFTFLISPLLATFFTTDSCFRYILVGMPLITTTFFVKQYNCNERCFNLVCVAVCQMSSAATTQVYSTVTPSWNYSYQCSSTLLINYVPVLLLSLTLSGVLFPFVKLLLLQYPNNFLFQFQSLIKSKLTKNKKQNQQSSPVDDSVRTRDKVFNGENYVSRMYVSLGMLTTFGLASPLLAIAIVIDNWSSIILLKVTIVRCIANCAVLVPLPQSAPQAAASAMTEEALETDAVTANPISLDISTSEPIELPAAERRQVWDLPMRAQAMLLKSIDGINGGDSLFALAMVLVVLVCFWSIFCFDMMADVYGDEIGVGMLLSPVALCVVAWVAMIVIRSTSCFSPHSAAAVSDIHNSSDPAIVVEQREAAQSAAGSRYHLKQTSFTDLVPYESRSINHSTSFGVVGSSGSSGSVGEMRFLRNLSTVLSPAIRNDSANSIFEIRREPSSIEMNQRFANASI